MTIGNWLGQRWHERAVGVASTASNVIPPAIITIKLSKTLVYSLISSELIYIFRRVVCNWSTGLWSSDCWLKCVYYLINSYTLYHHSINNEDDSYACYTVINWCWKFLRYVNRRTEGRQMQ
jgi:hypothetical protein